MKEEDERRRRRHCLQLTDQSSSTSVCTGMYCTALGFRARRTASTIAPTMSATTTHPPAMTPISSAVDTAQGKAGERERVCVCVCVCVCLCEGAAWRDVQSTEGCAVILLRVVSFSYAHSSPSPPPQQQQQQEQQQPTRKHLLLSGPLSSSSSLSPSPLRLPLLPFVTAGTLWLLQSLVGGDTSHTRQ